MRYMILALLLILAAPSWSATLDDEAAQQIYTKLQFVTPPFTLTRAVRIDGIDEPMEPYTSGRLVKPFEVIPLMREGTHKERLSAADCRRLVTLAAVLQMGHFCLQSGHQFPKLRRFASSCARQVGLMLAPTRAAELAHTYIGISEQLADGVYRSSSHSQLLSRYDLALQRVTEYVYRTYGTDGLWYYALGTSAAGLNFLTRFEDRQYAPVYLDLMSDLVRFRPERVPPSGTPADLRSLCHIESPFSHMPLFPPTTARILARFLD